MLPEVLMAEISCMFLFKLNFPRKTSHGAVKTEVHNGYIFAF